MQKRKGFTTVELVIVIAVIAILATALIPTFGGLIKSANHNVDVQAANQLTTLVVMHSVNHKINSESDLADAINEGMNDPNYYANLQAKSAKYGYCFWYDYADPNGARVRVGTVEEISAIATERVAQAFSIDDVRLGSAGSTSATHSFGLRADLIDGFVLMGYKGGNELMDLVCNLENAEDAGEYANAVAAIKAADSSNTAISNLQAKVDTTVIHNKHGAFALSSNATTVHIPQGTTELSNNLFVANGSDLTIQNADVAIPSTATVTSGSLAYLDASCSISINIPAEELKTQVQLQSTLAVIVVNNGNSYKQDITESSKNLFIPLTPGCNEIVGDAVTALKSFVLDDNGNDYVYIDTSSKIIYVSKDLTEAFVLAAGSFADENGNTTSHGFLNWYLDDSTEPLTNKGKTISIAPDVTKVKVETLGVENTYTVTTVKVESIAIQQIGGLKPTRSISFNNDTRSWALKTEIKLTDDVILKNEDGTYKVALDKTISIDNNRFTIASDKDGKNVTLSISKDLSGNSSNKVIFTSSGKASDVMTITLLDCSDSAFKEKESANTQSKYNFKLVVGTAGYAVTLGDLFVPNGVDSVYADVVVSLDRNNIWQEIPADDGWATTPLKLDGLSGEIEVYIKVADGQYSAPVMLNVVRDAYNVATINDWKNAPDNTSIVLINSLTGDNAIPGGDYTTANADGYSKDIGAATIYGNLKTISVPDNFKIIYGAYNYFIQSAGGTIDHLILVGPDYGSEVSVTGADNGKGDAETKGTHVSGIMAAGNINIYDSFISGFRSPLNVTVSGTITIKRTTLNRGNFANVNVEKASTFDMENVTTIQYEGKDKNYAAGFFFKDSSGTSTVKGSGLVQYNYATKKQIQSIAGLVLQSFGSTVADALDGLLISDSDFKTVQDANLGHSNNSIYHAGMFLLARGKTNKNIWNPQLDESTMKRPIVNIGELNNGAYVSSAEVKKPIYIKIIVEIADMGLGATIIGQPNTSCNGSCSNHTPYAIPAGSNATAYANKLANDFLASMEVKTN